MAQQAHDVGQGGRHRTALGAGLSDVWRRAKVANARYPAGTWPRAGLHLGLGFAATGAVVVGLTYLGRWLAERGMAAWDRRWLEWLVEEGPLTFPDAMTLESGGNLAYLVPLVAVTAVVALRWHRPFVAAAVVLGYALARFFIFGGWWLWDRARPDSVAAGVAAPGFHSYPSGHAVLSAFVWGFLCWLWIERSRSALERSAAVLLTTVWVAAIGVGRVRLGTHWPSDLVAGWLIAACWLSAVIWTVRRAERRARPLVDPPGDADVRPS